MIATEFIKNLAFLLPLFLIVYSIGIRLKLPVVLISALFTWHSFFSLIYFHSVQEQGGDSEHYFMEGLNGANNWSPGTNFIEALTGILVNYFGLTKLEVYFAYSIPGLIGLFLLANTVFEILPKHKNKYISTYTPYLILFSPNLNFWSCAIGKDGIAFLAGSLAAFASINFSKRVVSGLTSVLLMFLVRPHIALIIIVSFMLSSFSSKNSNSLLAYITKIFFTILLICGIFSYSIYYTSLEDVSVDGASAYVEARQNSNLEGSSSIEISSMPLPLQMFTYLFMPLFINTPRSMMALIVSTDNSLLLLWVLKNTFNLFSLKNSIKKREILFNIFYTILALLLLSTTTANSGIAIRQKTMFLPSFILLVSYSIRYASDEKTK
jgi:hypothetical protein